MRVRRGRETGNESCPPPSVSQSLGIHFPSVWKRTVNAMASCAEELRRHQSQERFRRSVRILLQDEEVRRQRFKDGRLREQVILSRFSITDCPFKSPTKLCNEVVTIDTIVDHWRNFHNVTGSFGEAEDGSWMALKMDGYMFILHAQQGYSWRVLRYSFPAVHRRDKRRKIFRNVVCVGIAVVTVLDKINSALNALDLLISVC